MHAKKIIFLLFFLLTFFKGICQPRSGRDLLGKWSASSLKLDFLPDGRVLFIMKGGTIPGARYKADFLQTPALLEIELVQEAGKIVYKSTVEFLNDNSLRLTTFDNDPRHVFDKQRSVVLTKEK